MRKVLHILSQLTDEDVDWMSMAGERRGYEPGDILIRQGEPNGALMFLLDGKIGIDVDGVRTAIWGSGEMLGEASLMEGAPPSATAVAIEPTHVLHVDGGVLHTKFDAEPVFAARLHRAIAAFQSIYMRSTDQPVANRDAATLDEDEIDMSLLDTVTVAGSRFDRMIKRLMTA